MKLLSLTMRVGFSLSAQEHFVYPISSSAPVTVERDVAFAEGLKLDLYRSGGDRSGTGRPGFLFLNTRGGGSVQRDWAVYQGWARLAALRGFGAILADCRDGTQEQDFDSLLTFLRAHGKEHGLDADRIAVYAASANVSRGLPFAENPRRTAIQAAVMYYGIADLPGFRPDLPVLFVRAGLDRPATNAALDRLIAAGLKANAPVSVLNHPSGHHGFEVIDDTEGSREVIDQTIRFVENALKPEYHSALRKHAIEAEAAGAVATGNFDIALAGFASLLPARQNDALFLLAYGEALIGGKRYREARSQFDRVKVLGGVGPRDLGVPAARAAALDGDAASALIWLESIPAQFRPAGLVDDPAFTSLRNRPEFQKLFARP